LLENLDQSAETLSVMQNIYWSEGFPNTPNCYPLSDAGCQTAIAQVIRDEKANYLLCVKDKQAHLRQDLEDWFVHGD
jgi:hypothetical protein